MPVIPTFGMGMSGQRSLFDELFDVTMMQYATWVMVRLYALTKVYEKLDKEMQRKIEDNIICKWDEEEMKMFEDVEERIKKGNVDGIELVTNITAMFACLAHAFRAVGLGDIVDVVIQLTEAPGTQVRN